MLSETETNRRLNFRPALKRFNPRLSPIGFPGTRVCMLTYLPCRHHNQLITKYSDIFNRKFLKQSPFIQITSHTHTLQPLQFYHQKVNIRTLQPLHTRNQHLLITNWSHIYLTTFATNTLCTTNIPRTYFAASVTKNLSITKC